MPANAQRVKLAVKLTIWFMLVSLLPLGWVGFFVLPNIAEKSLLKEITDNQEKLAVGFADTVSKFVATFRNVLAETAAIDEFATMNPVKQQQYLNRIMQVHAAIIEVSVVNDAGMEIMRTGRFLGPSPEMRPMEGDSLFTAGKNFGYHLGRLERFQGLYPTVNLSVSISDQKVLPPKFVGVLAAKISLNGLSQMLGMEFPLSGDSTAAVVGPSGFLIAHSNPKEVFRSQAKLSDDIGKYISTQSSDKGSGEIALPEGVVLGSFADVKDPPLDPAVKDLVWQVYVQQPKERALEASKQMKEKVTQGILILVALIIVISIVVAQTITRPIRVLQEATHRIRRELAEEEYGEKPELDDMPNDEIADLAQAFLDMRESIIETNGALSHTKQELEKSHKNLEKRVDAKTRELKAAQDELIKSERFAEAGKVASVVSHEIRNPLAVINNSIYYIKTKLGAGQEVDAKIAKHIKIIEHEVQVANGIINEMLDYTRTRPPQIERVDLNSFLEDLLATYPFPPHIALDKSLDPVNPHLDIDKTEVTQAMRNLIGNGIEVMPKGGRISVHTQVEGDWARIDVGDAGTGIAPDVLEKIFEAFFTTKAKGTGLGLAVVKKVADRHKGDVKVESVVGKGTTFKLYLPVVQNGIPPKR